MSSLFFGATLFPIFFFLVFGIIIAVIIKGLLQWNKNNHSPRLSVDAAVVDKYQQTDTSMHQTGVDGGMTHHHHTTFYAVFEVQSGDRMEFVVGRPAYSQLMPGDFGQLTFQGTRFIEFRRSTQAAPSDN